MGEIQVADSSDDPQIRTGSPSSRRAKRSAAPKLNPQGVPVTQWDDPGADPNKRAHIGDDPTGETNKL